MLSPTSRNSAILAVLLMISVGLLAYPLMVIQPFRYQGPTELKVALWIMQWRVWFELAAVVGALALCISFWRHATGRRSRIAFGAVTFVVCAAAALTRINIFETMFHRYDRPAFLHASDSKLDGAEKVMAISVNGGARAYPIRSMSYHHIVNDEVNGVAVVATY